MRWPHSLNPLVACHSMIIPLLLLASVASSSSSSAVNIPDETIVDRSRGLASMGNAPFRSESHLIRRASDPIFFNSSYDENASGAIRSCCIDVLCMTSHYVVCQSNEFTVSDFEDCARKVGYHPLRISLRDNGKAYAENICCDMGAPECKGGSYKKSEPPTIDLPEDNKDKFKHLWMELIPKSGDTNNVSSCCEDAGEVACGNNKRLMCRLKGSSSDDIEKFTTCVQAADPGTICELDVEYCSKAAETPKVDSDSTSDDGVESADVNSDLWLDLSSFDSSKAGSIKSCCKEHSGHAVCATKGYIICSFSTQQNVQDAFGCAAKVNSGIQMAESVGTGVSAKFACEARTEKWLNEPIERDPATKNEVWVELNSHSPGALERIKMCCGKYGNLFCSTNGYAICDMPAKPADKDRYDLIACAMAQDIDVLQAFNKRGGKNGTPETTCCTREKKYCKEDSVPAPAVSQPDDDEEVVF